jgi:hypothetical protein
MSRAEREAVQDNANWLLRQQIHELRELIGEIDRNGASKEQVRQMLRQVWLGMSDMRQDPESVEQEADDLTKSVASFLDANSTRADTERAALWVVKSFGARGGQAYPWSREREACLRLCQALTKSQLDLWRRYNRLPDGVNVDRPQPTAAVDVERQAM